MGSIVGAKLREYVRDVALHGLFRNCELSGDHLVRVPARDQSEHIDLACGQLVIRGMVSQLHGDLRGYSLFSGMDSTDGIKEFSMYVPLQHKSEGSRFKGSQHLNVACVRRQNDDPGIGELAANGDNRLNPVQARHLEIHQGHIRTLQPELLNSLLSVAGFSDYLHIRFSIDQSCDPLAEESVVVDGKNPNCLRTGAHDSSLCG